MERAVAAGTAAWAVATAEQEEAMETAAWVVATAEEEEAMETAEERTEDRIA